MRRAEGPGAEAARPGGWDRPQSTALGPPKRAVGQGCHNPSYLHRRKMILKAESEDWVSVCVVERGCG